MSIIASHNAEWKLEEARGRLGCRAGEFWSKLLTPANRERLGGTRRETFERGIIASWQKLYGVSERRAVIEAAAALNLLSEIDRRWLIREIGENDDDIDAAIDTAVATGGLVLVEPRRHVYWRQQAVEGNWLGQSTVWDYFWQLAAHSRTGSRIDSMTFEKPNDGRYTTTMKYRLTAPSTFPVSLADKIVSAGRGSQKLDLRPDQIFLFEILTTESLRPMPR